MEVTVKKRLKNYMVLAEDTKIVQSSKAYTQYLIIPSAVVRDSQYPFKDGGRVTIKVDPQRKMLIVTSAKKNKVH